jgi:hypothetical protein
VVAGLLSQSDPLKILNECGLQANFSPPGDDFGHEKKAALEYLAGLALALDTRSHDEPPLGVGEAALEVAMNVLALEVEVIANETPPPGVPLSLSVTRTMIRTQEIADRNQGYAGPLTAILRRVVEPLRADCRQRLGFDPADVPTVVDACRQLTLRRFADALHVAGERQPALDAVAATDEARRREITARWVRDMSTGMYEFSADEIASEARLAPSQVSAMLTALACDWHCQPGFRRLGDGNRFGRFPLIALDDGRYWFPLAWKPLDEFVPWLVTLLRDRQLPDLERRFFRSRDRATESMTREALASIFGEERVAGSLKYVYDGTEYELDVLVDAGPVAIVAEAKAHRVRDPLRRGALNEISTLSEKLLDEPFAQSARAAAYVGSGGRDFRTSRAGGAFVLSETPQEVICIATSFERIDPLTLHAASLVRNSACAWPVPLADFLAVTEVLHKPSSFYAYARLRAEIAADDTVTALTEPDLLGAFVANRLARPDDDHGESQDIVLDSAADIDAYFSVVAPTARPSLGIPPLVSAALQRLFDRGDAAWPAVARCVVEQPPAAWSSFEVLLANARAAATLGNDVRREFTLKTGLRLMLFVAPADTCFERLEGLQAPRPWLAIAERSDSGSFRVVADA